MSGFAAITGEPDGPPTLPPFGLADGIAGARRPLRRDDGASARRDRHRRRGQVVDLAIIEPILTVLGPQPTVYDQLGIVQDRARATARRTTRRATPTARADGQLGRHLHRGAVHRRARDAPGRAARR